MPAPGEQLISILLCCLPFLALLLFREQLQLGVIRVMGNHYNLDRPSYTLSKKSNTHRQIQAAIAPTSAEIGPLTVRREMGTIREGSAVNSRHSDFTTMQRQPKLKALQVAEQILPVRRVEGLRKLVRRNNKQEPLEFFWTLEDEIPIIKVLND